jgi:hypothetical protein
VAAETLQEVGHLAEEEALVHPEQVARGEHHHERRDRGGIRVELEGADEDQELADEPGQPGQSGRREREESERRGIDRDAAGETAHLRDRPIMGALVDDADQQEQGSRDEAVVDHLEDRPLEALLGEHEDAERHEAHVADRRVGDEPFQVGLDERHDRAVDDRDQRQHDDHRRERLGGRRVERHGEPDQAIRPELEHDRGEDHGARRRRLGVRVRQPRVEREHRHLDREREEERHEGGQLEPVDEAAGRRVGAERLIVERPGPRSAVTQLVGVCRRQDRHQHQERPDERVQDELDRGVDPVRAAPDPDDQVHRDEHDLPEDVEEERVEREEDPEHADLEDQERDHVFLDPRLDRLEAGEDRDPGHERGQHDECDRQPVRADLVLDAEDRDPGVGLGELEAGPAGQEADQQEQRQQECDEREPERGRTGRRRRQHGDHDRPDERQEDDHGQQRDRADVHAQPLASSRNEPAITINPIAMPSA